LKGIYHKTYTQQTSILTQIEHLATQIGAHGSYVSIAEENGLASSLLEFVTYKIERFNCESNKLRLKRDILDIITHEDDKERDTNTPVLYVSKEHQMDIQKIFLQSLYYPGMID
jgi:hypothetical protein